MLIKALTKMVMQLDNLLHGEVTRTYSCRWMRQNLSCSFVTYMEHGKPVSLLFRQVSKP